MVTVFRASQLGRVLGSEGKTLMRRWYQLSRQNLGRPIPVVVAERRANDQLAAYSGELNTALPKLVDGQLSLVVYLETIYPIDRLILTHEVGHWILKLQGFEPLAYEPNPTGRIASMLNSLATHPPLYELQRQHGIDPQVMIDSRATENTDLVARRRNLGNLQFATWEILLFADDMVNASGGTRDLFQKGMKATHSKLWARVRQIRRAAKGVDLADAIDNLAFKRHVTHLLRLEPDSWRPEHVLSKLKLLRQTGETH